MIRLRNAEKPRHPIRSKSILPLRQARRRAGWERIAAFMILVVVGVAAFDLCSGWL